jgi:hypothetical protein
MNNHACQYGEISRRNTGPLEQEQQQPQYRFEFEEFEERKGFLLLDKILDTIIPQAGYKVWRKIYDLVPNDPKPYVGSETLAAQADVTYRQINRALQALKEMGLMEEKTGLAHTKDGKGFAVIRKDFTNLYRFAHEYYLWMNSQGFAMYPPDRRFADMIKENRHLCAKLERFENYRIILKTERRGPKQVMTELLRWNSKDTIKLDENVQLGEERTNDLKLCVGTSKYQSESLYESNKLVIDSLLDSNLTQEKSFVTQDSPLTRRDDGEYPHDERGTHSEGETTGGSKGNEKPDLVSIPDQDRNNFPSEPEPKVKRNVPQTAKELSPQQKGKALIEAVLNEEDRKAHTPKQERRNKWLESKELQDRCKPIANLYSHIAEKLNDQNEKSTTTLLCKMFEESGKVEEDFIACVDYARQKVLSIPADKIRKRGADGKPNRTPLFIQILKDALKRGVAACQEDDRHADEVRNMFKVVEQEKAEQDAELDARDQALAGMEHDQDIQDMLYQAAVQSCAMQDEIEAQCEVVEPEPSPAAQEHDRWRDQLEASAKEIKSTTGLHAYVGGECEHCGCKIKVRIGWQPHCGWCEQPQSWTEDISARVANAIRDVYEIA